MPDPNGPISRVVVRMKWWHAGGLHAHVTYPDGSWERRTWKADQWWEVDALARRLKQDYGAINVQVSDGR
jgi:hypothetical protein